MIINRKIFLSSGLSVLLASLAYLLYFNFVTGMAPFLFYCAASFISVVVIVNLMVIRQVKPKGLSFKMLLILVLLFVCGLVMSIFKVHNDFKNVNRKGVRRYYRE